MKELRTLLAQSIFPRLSCSRYESDAEYRRDIDDLIAGSQVGGFVLFDGDVDLVSSVVAGLQDRAGGSLLFAADCEDGVTMRFPGGTEFPSMMALGEAGDLAATYSVGRSIAREMRALGIYWNFAPVADVNIDPENPIINIRSFGADPMRVADHVHAYMQGLKDGGVISCAKHFPGHGDTAVDSHLELPVIQADLRRLQSVELVPFRESIRNGVQSIMAAHVSVPALDPAGTPASLSKPIITGLLREQMGFDGVVVTDAMDMGAIVKIYDPARACLHAYQAGCDVIEIPVDPRAALAALEGSASAKTIGRHRIKQTVGRIAALKKWTADYHDDKHTIAYSRKGHDVIALEAARRSIRVAGRLRKLYPPLFVVAFVDAPENEKPGDWFTYFSAWYDGEATGAIVMPAVSREEMEEITRGIEGAGSVIVALFVRPRGAAGSIGLTPDQMEIFERAAGKPYVLLNFGNPYLLADAEPKVRIDTFSASSASMAASIEALSRVVK
jgi:beta-glucosidase-like glycosyl hydrolase